MAEDIHGTELDIGEEELTAEQADHYEGRLKKYVDGIQAEFGENKITILPNWEKAKRLYEKLYKNKGAYRLWVLDEIMEPVFAQEKSRPLSKLIKLQE